MIKEQKKSLLRRRKIYMIIAAVLVLVLIPTLVTITYLSKHKTFEDVDGVDYKLKYVDGFYYMYGSDKNELDYDEELRVQVSAGEMYRFYITDAGTIVKVNMETGEYEIYAVVDTIETEQVGFNSRLLIYPRIEKDRIRSIEVINSKDHYTFYRYNVDLEKIDDSCDFVIKGAPFAKFDEEFFSLLYLGAGYTITTQKVEDPIKDEATGEYLEYGLGKQIRIDDDGKEYEYSPAYVTLTDTSGNKHKLIVGDKLVTGSGYYVQYVSFDGDTEVKRDAVYVLDNDVGTSAFETVEAYVSPTITYPLSVNDYLRLKNFIVHDAINDSSIVAFSYLPSEERGPIYTNVSYKFDTDDFDGYIPKSENISSMLSYFYQMDFVGTTALSPTDDEFIKYGLGTMVEKDGEEKLEFTPAYHISFDYDIYDNDKYINTLKHLIYVSEKNDDGNYYAYSFIYDSKTLEPMYSYDMIVEVQGHCFNFLEWSSSEWIEDRYIHLNIAHCQKIKLESGDYWAEFELDNKASDQSQTISSALIQIFGKDSNGNDIKTFSTLSVPDKSGNVWTITQSDITAKNSIGTQLTIGNAYYADNMLGKQVRVIPEYIPCYDGSKVEVSADKVVITLPNGEKTTYLRCATDLFRRLYQTFTMSTLEGSYNLSEEDEAALLADPAKHMLTITMTDIEGTETVYKFCTLTSQKAYITVNGNGGFYVVPSRVKKFISDTQKFFNFELVDPSAKN